MNAANVVSRGTRRSGARGATPAAVRVRFDAYELDERNALLLRDGKAVAIAPRPFSLLCALAREPGSLVTKNALLDDVWGHQFFSDSVLKTAVSEVRTALDDDPREPRFIKTVSRRGYRFIAATTALPDPAPIPGTDFSGPPSFDVSAQAVAHADAVPCAAACMLPRPVYATTEEVRYARELKRRLMASFFGRCWEESPCP